jgi:RNA polymerase sigma-70 factor (ECF subfamily)
VQAAIASLHADQPPDWAQIAALYGELARLTDSPIVELNRAVAVAMADGPAAGLAIVDDLRDDPTLKNYHLLPSVRGDLLVKLGRTDEARGEFEAAAAMTGNEQERALLLARAAAC